MATSMDELVDRFKVEARERSDGIQSLLSAMVDDESDAERCNEIREEAHKLKGAAGILGFPELKERAAELENVAAAQAETAAGGAAREAIALAAEAVRDALP